jgi:hypothetical protein
MLFCCLLLRLPKRFLAKILNDYTAIQNLHYRQFSY